MTRLRSRCNLAVMAIRRSCAKTTVAILLLALIAAPIASEVFAQSDPHGCCPEPAATTDAPEPCQYVAPLACCAQLAVPATTVNAHHELGGDFVVTALVGPSPAPLAPTFARARNGHGPPQAERIRTIVLQL